MKSNCLRLTILGLIKKIFCIFIFLVVSISPVNSAVNSDNQKINTGKESNTLAYFAELKSSSKKSARYENHQPAGNTVVIYLMGLAGTGKYTIAKKLSQRGYKVVDNHLINNPIFSLLGPDAARQATVEATEKIGRIRNIVLEFMVEDNRANYVLTNQLLQNEYHDHIYNQVLNAANKRGSIFVPVLLVISSEERSKRLAQPDRARRFKITDRREAFKSPKMLKVTHENLMELNVSNLSPDQAAEQIIRHIERIKN